MKKRYKNQLVDPELPEGPNAWRATRLYEPPLARRVLPTSNALWIEARRPSAFYATSESRYAPGETINEYVDIR